MTTYSSIYRQADKRKLNVKANMFINELIGLSEKYNGFIYRYNDLCLIAYDDTMNDTSQELTALHELGHLLLEHWDSKDSVKRMKQTVGEMQIGEFMADMFACVVTALKMYKECY